MTIKRRLLRRRLMQGVTLIELVAALSERLNEAGDAGAGIGRGHQRAGDEAEREEGEDDVETFAEGFCAWAGEGGVRAFAFAFAVESGC